MEMRDVILMGTDRKFRQQDRILPLSAGEATATPMMQFWSPPLPSFRLLAHRAIAYDSLSILTTSDRLPLFPGKTNLATSMNGVSTAAQSSELC